MNYDIPTIFNNAIASYSIAAAFDVGLLDAIDEGRTASLDDLCRKCNLRPEVTQEVIRNLVDVGVLECVWAGDTPLVDKGPRFAETIAAKGFFLWLSAGYGEMLARLSDGMQGRLRSGRNGRAVAKAAGDCGKYWADDDIRRIVLKDKPKRIADLGCGSAARLIDLVQASEDPLHGIGIDIDAGAVQLARERVASAALSDRILVVHSDIRDLDPLANSGVDTLLSVFMGHDLWPRDTVVGHMIDLRKAFPDLRRFILCDTCRSRARGPAPRIFERGFELVHAVQGQYVPTYDEWLPVFTEAGWRCQAAHELRIPNSYIFELAPEVLC